MSEITLKPCPFCKNEMHFIPTDQPKGWRVDGRHKSSCPLSILTHDDCTAFVTREAAAESWNTRARESDLEKLVRGLWVGASGEDYISDDAIIDLYNRMVELGVMPDA